jgi:uncharacterized protein
MLLRTYYEIHPGNRNVEIHLFLDEIQNVEGWERFVRRVMDSGNVRIYITGSSSKMLSSEIATSMRGRALSYTILPFSFAEYLKAREFDVEEFMSSSEKDQLMSYLSNYMRSGGFPEVVLEEDDDVRVRILKDYVEVMLLRDVVERYAVKNVNLLKTLYGGLVSSTSSTFSTNKFYNHLKSSGRSLSKNTLYDYMKHLEDVYAIHVLRSFSYSHKKIEQSLPKVYPIDPGLLRVHSIQRHGNLGTMIENVVAIELLRLKSSNPHLEVYYWKDSQQREVDFVVKNGECVESLIQVCYDIEEYRTKEREIRSLIKASSELSCENLVIITWEKDGVETVKGKKIVYIPLWKWLIKPGSFSKKIEGCYTLEDLVELNS